MPSKSLATLFPPSNALRRALSLAIGFALCGGLFAAMNTAGPAAEPPRVVSVGTVTPMIVALRIRAQQVEHGRQVPFTAQPGDQISDGHYRFVHRGGKLIGALAGAEGKILFTCDELHGEPLDVKWATRPESYRLRAADAAPGAAMVPVAVYRKSRPFDFCRTAEDNAAPQDHFLYLKLPAPLEKGKRYTLQFENGTLASAETSFLYDPATLVSEAVHVSQIGFRPDDPAKVAFLSCWMGDGGGVSFGAEPEFSVIDADSGKIVFAAKARLAKSAADDTDGYEKSDVYEMDFSALTRPGTYRVSVAGVGCSIRFVIDADAWTRAFTVSVRGLYHQRSGIALGPPYTEYRRPRSFHPDDGVKVYHTSYEPGKGGGFRAIVAGRTDEIVPNAWGGYMDAGDWDRRPIHAYVPRLLFDLYEMAPARFDKLNLNLPESADALPDVLNEALWFVDFHLRLQTPEGGIRPGIESAEHPRRGEASWQESLMVMAYAPSITMSYKYAAVAAHAALLLEARDTALAKRYGESALRAFRWADQQASQHSEEGKDGERLLAAAELFRLTGAPEWEKIFLTGTRFRDAKTAIYRGHNPSTGIYDPQDEAGWVYWRTDRPGTNATVKESLARALVAHADARRRDIAQTAFRWTGSEGKKISYSTSVIPDAVAIVRAHHVTQDAKYLQAAILACQQGAGANPLNLCYTTGVGTNFQQHMVHEDSYASHQPLPPGLTVNGPFDPRNSVLSRHQATVNSFRQFVYPKAETWPALESYFDVGMFSPMSEYTVHRNIAPNAYVWGYLALAR